MPRKGISPPTTKTFLKIRYPLPCAGFESSGDDRIESSLLEALADGQKEQRSPSPLPCAEPESSGDGEIESGSLKVLVHSQEAERWDIPLEVRPDDMTGKHWERRKRLLIRA